MTTIYFVRHGEAEAGFGAHRDPGLSALGRTQAIATAKHLASLDPIPIFSSPLLRAQETAQELAQYLGFANPPSKIALPKSLHRLRTLATVRHGWRT